MNKRTILPLTITLALALNASAQTPADTRHTAWSMDSCMSYAVKHSTDVQLQLVERRQARADYRWAKAGFLPQVGANVSTQWSWGRGINPETNVYTNVTTFNNYYNLYASLTVFDGMRTINAFRQARLLRRSSDAAVAKARDAKAIEVMQLYAVVLQVVRDFDRIERDRDVEVREEHDEHEEEHDVKPRRVREDLL